MGALKRGERGEPNPVAGSHTWSSCREAMVEALRISSKSRYFVFLAVAGGHALVLAVLLYRSATTLLPSPAGTPITAFLLLRPAHLRAPPVPAPLNRTSVPIAPLVAPIAVAAPGPLMTSPGGCTVDWNAAAKQAAASALKTRKRISFGFPAGGESAITLGVPSRHTPAHYAGESDRTVAGEHVEWTSDRCYVASDPPLPGEPDFLKHARVSHSGCLPPDGPDPGELFKSLPAYKKYHPP